MVRNIKKNTLKGMLAFLAFSTFTGINQEMYGASFKNKNVRVVIGSTSTSGDSYLVADTVSRHLSKELGAKLKVDAVGAAEALASMQTSKPNGNTLMMFHDMTYLGVAFGSYDKDYSLENMEIGPQIAQNPGAAWAASKNAPYQTLAEIPEYLKSNSDKIIRMACEAGGVSHIAFIVYYDWVLKNYGKEIADRIVVVLGGSTADKAQLLWDGNCDVIFADYTSLKDYTETADDKIAMKFMALLDNVEGIDVKSYRDQGITLNGENFTFSKDFLIYMPKKFPADLKKELDDAMKKVSADPVFNQDLNKMNYRAQYKDSSNAKEFIYKKRDNLQTLISSSPSLDDLVQK